MNMKRKTIIALITAAVMTAFCGLTAFADGDVAGAVESTWNSAQSQIKTIVNNVVFPVIDVILAILLFAKLATSYLDYRKHGQFEWAAPAILFGCLLF
jgi:cell shape-determining protein MreC